MEFITIQTDTWAHSKDYGAELHRFQVITRHWISEDGLYKWQHNITYIDRKGLSTRLENTPSFDSLWDRIDDYIRTQGTSETQYYPARVKMVEQHSWILIRLIG